MVDFDILASVTSAFRDAPHQMLQVPLIFIGFLIGAVVYYLLAKSALRGTQRGFRSAMAFILKKDLYRNPTTRVDVWNYILAEALWFPLMRVVLTTIGTVLSAKVIYGWLLARFGPGTTLLDGGRGLVAFQVTARAQKAHMPFKQFGHGIVVMTDPDGNEVEVLPPAAMQKTQ